MASLFVVDKEIYTFARTLCERVAGFKGRK